MPNRCTHCRQEGHNRTTCPHDAWHAASLREAYNAQLREERRSVNERFQAAYTAETRQRIDALHQRISLLAASAAGRDLPSAPPTVREKKVQEILFERAEELNDGLYKELMDALVLKDWNKLSTPPSGGQGRRVWKQEKSCKCRILNFYCSSDISQRLFTRFFR